MLQFQAFFLHETAALSDLLLSKMEVKSLSQVAIVDVKAGMIDNDKGAKNN